MTTQLFVSDSGSTPGPSSVTSTPASSPNITVDSPAPRIKSIPQKHQQHYRITAIPGIGIGVILLAVLLQIILVVLIRKKSKELKNAEFPAQNQENTFHHNQSWRYPEGLCTSFHLLSYYLANKRSLHVRSQGLKIPTLIGEKYKNKNYPPLPL